jgi:hypothetical protein
MPAATGLMHARDRRHLAPRSPTYPLAFAFFAAGCGDPVTTVILDSRYPPSTELVFPGLFTTLAYDAATCTTTPVGDAGGS